MIVQWEWMHFLFLSIGTGNVVCVCVSHWQEKGFVANKFLIISKEDGYGDVVLVVRWYRTFNLDGTR